MMHLTFQNWHVWGQRSTICWNWFWMNRRRLFNKLCINKLKFVKHFKFQGGTRIFLSRMQNGLSRTYKGMMFAALLFWLVLLAALYISANITILSKSKETFRLKCRHHGYDAIWTCGNKFLGIMFLWDFLFYFFSPVNSSGTKPRSYEWEVHKTIIFYHISEK